MEQKKYSLSILSLQVAQWSALWKTANLWKTFFALVVELSLRSGLVTEEELVPSLSAPAGSELAQPQVPFQHDASRGRMDERNGDHELVEFAQKPDAETEPGYHLEGIPQLESEGAAPLVALVALQLLSRFESMNEHSASSHRDFSLHEEGNVVTTGVSPPSYPAEYDPLTGQCLFLSRSRSSMGALSVI